MLPELHIGKHNNNNNWFEWWMFGLVVKIPVGTPTTPIRVPQLKPLLCSWFQIPASAHPGRQHWWLGDWAPATYMEDPSSFPGSQICHGPTLAIVGIWGVNQQTGVLYLLRQGKREGEREKERKETETEMKTCIHGQAWTWGLLDGKLYEAND